jgi:hypothetical protein
MEDIYYMASQVIVWLGQGNDKSDLLFRHLKRIGRSSKHRYIPEKSPPLTQLSPEMLPRIFGGFVKLLVEKYMLHKIFDKRFMEALWNDDGKFKFHLYIIV